MSATESPVDPARTSLLREMHASMLTIRLFEERIADLLEAKEVKCPCHLYIGQEAIATGVCSALEKEDQVWGGHRSHGHYLAKGGNLREMMAEIFGKATGCSQGRGGSMHVFAPEVGVPGTVPLVAATIPLAVGAGLASKLRNDGHVSATFFGDGATEEGHFHESMILAAVYRLPVLFICENNLYSSHMHILERRAKDNIWMSAEAHGAHGVQIDGNDVIEVRRAAVEAVQRARSGEGPTLIECRTYRWRGHVGPKWDEDVGLKRKDELEDWLPKDPIARAKSQLMASGVDEAELAETEEAIREEIEAAVEFARESPYPAEDELLKHVFCQEQST